MNGDLKVGENMGGGDWGMLCGWTTGSMAMCSMDSSRNRSKEPVPATGRRPMTMFSLTPASLSVSEKVAALHVQIFHTKDSRLYTNMLI